MTDNCIVKEITVSLSGVIPVAPYENLRPGFSMTVEPKPGEDPKKIIAECQDELHLFFENESIRGTAELRAIQVPDIRWYARGDGDYRGYPSVTSILFYDAKWHVTEQHLNQLASRGTIVGEITEQYLSRLHEPDHWLEPQEIPSLQKDVDILLHGASDLHWDQCSHKEFCKEYGDRIKIESTQGVVFNDEHVYAGTYDLLGTFDGKKTLMDIKCGATRKLAQLAAYAKCIEGVEQIMILPLGPTDNKCGFIKPTPCTDIQKEFDEFIRVRKNFKKQFGI